MSIFYISVIKKSTDRNIYSQFYHSIGYLINELNTFDPCSLNLYKNPVLSLEKYAFRIVLRKQVFCY